MNLLKVRTGAKAPTDLPGAPDAQPAKPVSKGGGVDRAEVPNPWVTFAAQQGHKQDVDPAAIGRAAIGRGGRKVQAFGVRFDRLGKVPKAPVGPERLLANTLGGLFAAGALGTDRYRTAEAVSKAWAQPPVQDGMPLGRTTLVRPGLGNTAPGPAQIARLLKHTEQVIVAYANPGEGAQASLRPINEIDGVPLPAAAQGRVFAIGSPDNVMMDYAQASDVFIGQLGRMQSQGLDLRGEKATVIAHSQGGLDTVLTRKRLEAEGLDDVFGQVVTLATPFDGSPVSDEHIGGVFTELLGGLTGAQSMRAVNRLDPDFVANFFDAEDRNRFVDLAVTGGLRKGEGADEMRKAFSLTHGVIRAAQAIPAWVGGDKDLSKNDGLVTIASQEGGKQQLELQRSHDHASIAEVPDVIDQVVRKLAEA